IETAEPQLEFYRRFVRPFFTARFLQLLPLSHMFGQVTSFGLAPLISASVTITRRQSPAALLDAIRERRITAAICVPRVLDVLRSHISRLAPETSGLRRSVRIHRILGWRFFGFLLGGAPLEPELERFW